MHQNRYFGFSTLVLLTLLCLPGRSHAQSMTSFGMVVGVPTEEFAGSLDAAAPAGMTFEYLVGTKRSPFKIGLGYNMFGYGRKTWNENWGVGGSVVDAQYTISSMIFDLEGRTRMEIPVAFPIKPYLHGFAGLSMLSTTFTVEDLAISDGTDCVGPVYEEKLSKDKAAVYGGGFGLMIPLCLKMEDSPVLDLSLGYRNSGVARYMNREAETVYTTRTTMWILRAGISFRMI